MNSQHEFDAVVRAACEGATVLTGNTRATRFLLAACDRKLGAEAQAWKTPDILPFGTWVQRCFREAQIAGSTELVLLNHRQSLALWKQCIADAPGTTDLLRPTNASGQASQAWTLIHEYRIPLNHSFESTSQSKAFATWAKRYRQLTERNGWTDSARVADELVKVLDRDPELLPSRILLWGCGELTPQARELIAAVAASGRTVEVHEIRVSGWEHARRIACDDSIVELRRAAMYARDVLKKNPAKRIGVVLPNLRDQRARAEAVFTEVLHPEFYVGADARTAFEISLGEPLGNHALVRAALMLLRFAINEMKYQELREFLTSPYLGGFDEESQERARLCRWLGENGPERTSVRRLLREINPAEQTGRAAEELKGIEVPRLRKILGQIARVEGLPTRAAVSEWVTEFGKLLRKAEWPREDGKKLGSANFQAYRKWMELLSDLASLDLTQGAVTFAEAVEEVTRAADAQTFAPENLGAAVQLMDVDESAGSLFDELWVCGLDDETWPRRVSRNAFIPTQLLRGAKVPGSTPESLAEQATKEMERLLASAPTLMLSYPLSEGDRKLRMSQAIARAAKCDWEQLGISAEPSWIERMRGSNPEELLDSRAPALTDAELMHRGTSLVEKQAACPFRAFAELRLGARQQDEPAAGIEPTQRGNLIENVLELFWMAGRDLENMRGLPPEERARLIKDGVERAVRRELGEGETPAEKRLRAIESDRLAGLTEEWLQVEEKRTPFIRVRHQQSFEYEVAGVRLKGRIDRVDWSVNHDGEVVIDYKSGASAYNKRSWETPRPKMPQLPLYAAYLQSEGKKVVGVGFGLLNTAKSKIEGIAVSNDVFGCYSQLPKWAKSSLEEQIEEWTREVEKLVSEHLAGAAEVDPKVPPSRGASTCQYCHLHSMCRISDAVLVDDDEENGDE